jgi:hypothetical protein
MNVLIRTSGGRNTIGIQYIFQYFGVFGYFMEYNTARSIPILFLVEYGIPYDISIPEEIVIQEEFRIMWNTAYDIF